MILWPGFLVCGWMLSSMLERVGRVWPSRINPSLELMTLSLHVQQSKCMTAPSYSVLCVRVLFHCFHAHSRKYF